MDFNADNPDSYKKLQASNYKSQNFQERLEKIMIMSGSFQLLSILYRKGETVSIGQIAPSKKWPWAMAREKRPSGAADAFAVAGRAAFSGNKSPYFLP
jgi:hypothetical protein